MENIAEKLAEFWVLTRDVWQDGVYGVDLGRIVTALGIFFGFLIVRRLFTRVVIRSIQRAVSRTRTTLDDLAVTALEKPIRFVPLVLGAFFAVDYLDLPGTLDEIGTNLVRSLIAFTIFWALHSLVSPMSGLLDRMERLFTTAMVNWTVSAIKVVVVAIGVATILEIWGIQVAPIIAGFGLFGVAVALGAQDLFKNLIAGLMIVAEKRFQIGDWIKVDGVVEGTVENIGFRSTLVRRFDKAPVTVPNTKFSDSAVINFSAMTNRRIYWRIGLEYRSSVAQLRRVRDEIEAYVLGNEDFEKPPRVSTFVRIDRFSDSSIDVMLYCFTKTTKWGEWLRVKEDLAYRIKEIVEGAGTGFAFPSQSLYVETLPSENPEDFTPPTEIHTP
ncbi:mechanosensitive ion channel family protein [Magnetospira sp. QH-2]|uniref:mechanosensitive ion channel family protein n=1 Tax=Magnetospira sp. (strain QH-2) TaxID=1288970 RepID=UPI0006979A67|nr:mechanosensitive ion channel family protein [Magnetospira sp. QH-2]